MSSYDSTEQSFALRLEAARKGRPMCGVFPDMCIEGCAGPQGTCERQKKVDAEAEEIRHRHERERAAYEAEHGKREEEAKRLEALTPEEAATEAKRLGYDPRLKSADVTIVGLPDRRQMKLSGSGWSRYSLSEGGIARWTSITCDGPIRMVLWVSGEQTEPAYLLPGVRRYWYEPPARKGERGRLTPLAGFALKMIAGAFAPNTTVVIRPQHQEEFRVRADVTGTVETEFELQAPAYGYDVAIEITGRRANHRARATVSVLAGSTVEVVVPVG